MASFAEKEVEREIHEEEVDPEFITADDEPYLTVPSGGEGDIDIISHTSLHPMKIYFVFVDWEGSASAKEKANEAKGNGDFESAIQHFTQAMELGQVSALTLGDTEISFDTQLCIDTNHASKSG